MIRKVTLNLVLVVMASASALAQGLFVNIILLLCITAHVRFQPYAEGILNRIELASLILSVSVLQIGFFLFDDGLEPWLETTITVFLVTIIVVCFVAFVVILVMQIKTSRTEAIRKRMVKTRENAHAFESGLELAVTRLRGFSRARSPSAAETQTITEVVEIENPWREGNSSSA